MSAIETLTRPTTGLRARALAAYRAQQEAEQRRQEEWEAEERHRREVEEAAAMQRRSEALHSSIVAVLGGGVRGCFEWNGSEPEVEVEGLRFGVDAEERLVYRYPCAGGCGADTECEVGSLEALGAWIAAGSPETGLCDACADRAELAAEFAEPFTPAEVEAAERCAQELRDLLLTMRAGNQHYDVPYNRWRACEAALETWDPFWDTYPAPTE
jgi:hypothetical protein